MQSPVVPETRKMEGAPRQNFFGGDRGAQRRYYGVKRQIAFKRRFPLTTHTYYPLARGTEDSLRVYGASFREANAEQRAMRERMLMTGRGLYKGGRGGYFGRMLGNLVGAGDLGDKLGDAAWNVGKNFIPKSVAQVGQSVFNITDKFGRGLYKGRGSYTTATNGLIAGSSVVPQFGQDDMKSTTITNREFIGDVYAPLLNDSFSAKEYPINPGMRQLFAWLSQLAINYEEYELKQLIVTYKSTVTDFASNSGQVGQIIMATHYNPTADPFGSKEEMMLYEGGMSCKTTEHMQHGIECDPSKLTGNSYKYVRIGDLPISEDLKEYDLGRFCLAITGVPATYAGQVLGELWVSYTVTLRKPKVASGHAYNVLRDLYVSQYNTAPGPLQIAPIPATSWIHATRNSGAISLLTPGATLDAATLNGYDSLIDEAPTPLAVAPAQVYAMFILEFADWFEGCVNIRVTHATQQPYVPSGMYIISSDQPAVTTRPSTIARFKDIPVFKIDALTKHHAHMVQTVDNSVVTGPPEQGGLSQDSRVDVDLHLRILPAQAGIKNRLTFCWNNVAASAAHLCKIEVSQYNTFLSNTDNGRGPATLLLTDFNGNPSLWQ